MNLKAESCVPSGDEGSVAEGSGDVVMDASDAEPAAKRRKKEVPVVPSASGAPTESANAGVHAPASTAVSSVMRTGAPDAPAPTPASSIAEDLQSSAESAPEAMNLKAESCVPSGDEGSVAEGSGDVVMDASDAEPAAKRRKKEV